MFTEMRDSPRFLVAALTAMALAACGGGGDGGGNPPPPPAAVRFVPAFGGEQFALPVKLVQHPTDADRWYVVEQGGKVFTLVASNPAATRTLAVDVEALFDLASGGEQGLLGMAFSPGFATSGELFLGYTELSATNSDSVVARFASADGGLTFAPVAGNPDVIRFHSEQSNHNGGRSRSAPTAISTSRIGDGGAADDPHEQRPEPEHAARQDPAHRRRPPRRRQAYAIPPDNPFVGVDGARAGDLGLRPAQPVADQLRPRDRRPLGRRRRPGPVGGDRPHRARRQLRLERREGRHPFRPDAGADPDPPPFVERRRHTQSGPLDHRRLRLPRQRDRLLANTYIYGDFVTGRVFAYRFLASPPRVDELSPPAGLGISSFGQARDGEIYLVDYGGTVYKLEP